MPTNRLILVRFLCLREENNLLSSKEIINTIFSEVDYIWKRAFIPIKGDKKQPLWYFGDFSSS
jgi:hypothetical protein